MRTIWTFLACGFLISFLSIFGQAKPGTAALPPLSPDQLQQESAYIAAGQVKRVSCREVRTDLGTNNNCVAIVKVEKVEKEPALKTKPPVAIRFKAGQSIKVHYWRLGKRPRGWVGNGGQYEDLRPNTRVRVYLRTKESNRLHLLEPNGWESLPIGN